MRLFILCHGLPVVLMRTQKVRPADHFYLIGHQQLSMMSLRNED